jgi:flagellar hook-basal body complex protein FliE
MPITNASAIQSALQQIQALAGQAAGKSSPVVDNGTAGSFASALQDSIRRINQLQTTSDTRRDAFLAGDPGLALNDVMVDMQKASVAFQMGVQVRNRLVSAYKDVMNMQV